jgi:cyclic pyranopterin phosphate synthase
MADTADRAPAEQTAMAEAIVRVKASTLARVIDGSLADGDALALARVAGMTAAKKAFEILPLRPSLPLTAVTVLCEPDEAENLLRVLATVRTSGERSVETEALTAASVAALALCDVLLPIERDLVIETIRLVSRRTNISAGFRGEDQPNRHVATRRASAVQIKARRSRPSGAIKELAPDTPQRKSAADVSGKRDALRRFMQSRGLTAHAWARDAGLPVGVLYSYLHGRTHALSRLEEERLARATNVEPEDLYRG